MHEWTGVADKRVILTGGTGGIGLAAAKELAARGALLTLVARSETRARAAITQIAAAAPSAVPPDVLMADLASVESVRALAFEVERRYPAVDVLINNAGAIFSHRQLTRDGFEMTWALNHIAPFVLTTSLFERLKSSAPARVITTSSAAHFGNTIQFDDLTAARGYRRFGFTRYGETKLANILFTVELARRLEGTGVTANCFHPGFVKSGFNRNNGALLGLAMAISGPFARTVEKGAETLVWLADAPEVSGMSGTYFVDKREARRSPAARDTEAARRLWDLTAQAVQPSAATAA
jgi:NAD(P)-dependent dehydrogenase (short-subunit alcohol dehydrogenase family)